MVYLGSHLSAFARCSTTLHKSLVSMAVWKGNCHRTGDRSLGKQSWLGQSLAAVIQAFPLIQPHCLPARFHGRHRSDFIESVALTPFHTLAFPVLCLTIRGAEQHQEGNLLARRLCSPAY